MMDLRDIYKENRTDISGKNPNQRMFGTETKETKKKNLILKRKTFWILMIPVYSVETREETI